MRGLGMSVEWLRPLVETKGWDYIVVWKYGDDPTRFIEWMGCCCRGGCNGSNEQVKTEEEKGEDYRLIPICRDSYFQHPVRTKACEALAQLPHTMPLYSGVHGDVAISKQPRWFTQDSTGTQVLIPIIGGLVELFTAKLIPKDIRIIEFITAHCCVSLKKEAMSAQSYTSLSLNERQPSEEHYPQSWPPTPLTPSLNSSVHLPAVNQCSSHPNIEGSSSGSNPSNEHPSFDSKFVYLIQHEPLKKSVKKSTIIKRPKCNETSGKQQRGLGFNCGTLEEDKSEMIREPQREGYLSKNLVTERNRRNRIKGGLFTLRALVPKITKMDRAAILGDAIDYIKELQEQVEGLEDEIRDLEEEDCEKNTPQLGKPTDKEQEGTRSLPLSEIIQSSSGCNKKTQVEVQVEVNQIERSNFLIRLCCEQKRGGFARLMEALHSFGLLVAHCSVIPLDGKVLNVLTVEANKQDIHPKKLREYLTEQAGSW